MYIPVRDYKTWLMIRWGNTAIPILLRGSSFFLCLTDTSHILICAHFLLPCHWAPLRRVWLSLRYFSPSQVFVRSGKTPLSLLFSRLKQSQCSQHLLIWPLWPFTGLTSVCLCFSCKQRAKNWTECSSYVFTGLRGGAESHYLARKFRLSVH